MEEVLVSVICNTYNHEAYIRQCLDGFLAQKTSFPFEVLVHDDASTDHTADIIREYEAKYPDFILPIYQTENQYSKGVPISIAIQFPRSRGKYVAFCEGDDYWIDPLKLEKQVSFLEDHDDYSSAVHNVLTVDKDSNPLYENNFGDNDFDFYIDGELHFPQTSSFVMRNPFRNQSESGRAISSMIFGSDSSYILYMQKAGKTRFFSDYMSHYRLVTDSGDSHSARKKRSNMTEFWINNELRLYRQIEAYQMDVDISPHVFKNMCIYPFMFFVRHPNLENWKLYVKARRQFPYSEWVFLKQLLLRLTQKVKQ